MKTESSVLVPCVTRAETSKVKHMAVSKSNLAISSTLMQTMLSIFLQAVSGGFVRVKSTPVAALQFASFLPSLEKIMGSALTSVPQNDKTGSQVLSKPRHPKSLKTIRQ